MKTSIAHKVNLDSLITPEYTGLVREGLLNEISEQLVFSFGVGADFLDPETFDPMKKYALGLAINQVAENMGLRAIRWKLSFSGTDHV